MDIENELKELKKEMLLLKAEMKKLKNSKKEFYFYKNSNCKITINNVGNSSIVGNSIEDSNILTAYPDNNKYL